MPSRTLPSQPPQASGWRADLLAALAATLVTFAFYAIGGFSELGTPNGDNDALMRLIQVRDLIAGQDWFDPTQYRMGPEGGFPMHWSRLIDAPIAALVIAGTVATGSQAAGEAFASIAWPQFLYGAALVMTLRAARRFAGEEAVFPALVIGAISLHASGLFMPGALDHHSPQLVLTLALVAFLLAGADNRSASYGAGAAAALMLAIGMEALPYVATAGLCVAMLFLLRGGAEAGRAARFGLSFALLSLLILALTVPRAAWLAAHCDAFSIAQAALSAGAGLGLSGVVFLTGTRATIASRAAWLAALAGSLAAVAFVAFPQCLDDPFASLDPRLRTYWLDWITEAQSARDLFANDPARVASYFATPVLALVVLATRIARKGFRGKELIVTAFLASATLVAVWQIRGATFALPLAVIPLSAWVADWRMRAARLPSTAKTLQLVLAWLLSFNLVWHTAANAAESLFGQQDLAEIDAEDPEACYRPNDYAHLASLPAGTVLAVSNLGASILAFTRHRALAGSYHRNADGNLMALDALMGPLDVARETIQGNGVDFVAFCPGNDESVNLSTWSPAGLEASLRRRDVPNWLEQVAGSESQVLRIYRVRPQS